MRNDTKDHKLSQGWRKIHQSKCADESCEFFGKPAQQGVCYSRLSQASAKYVESVRKYAESRLAEAKRNRKARKCETDAQWIKYLEGNLLCQWMNEEFTLDELIALRMQVGKLANRLKK